MDSNVIRVVIVEDDEDLRKSLLVLLSLHGFSVAGCGSCREFYRELDRQEYDIALLDIGLPDQSGTVLSEYLRDNTTMGIIMLTARDSQADSLVGYEAGADVYLTKPADGRLLVSAITNLAKRIKPRSVKESPAEQKSWVLDQLRMALLTPSDEKIALTGKEFSFLLQLAQANGVPVSRADIMLSLYNHTDEYSGKALDALIYRLRSKVTASATLRLPVTSIHSVGYSFTALFTLC
jgi:DNA-binding response OmpR family regulator